MTPSLNTHFFDSFWKASFYQEGKAVSFWKAFWKVVLVIFLMSIVTSVVFYVTFGKKMPASLHSYANQALNGYPSDLVITIKDGELSKNIPGELHLYPLPKETMIEKPQEDSSFEYALTINDTESVSLSLYQKSKSLIVLAKDGMVIQDNKGIKIAPYKEMSKQAKDFSFTKSMIVPVVAKVNEYADVTPFVIMMCIVIFMTIFSSLTYLTLTLFYGLVVMLLSVWITGKKIGFSESYILSLYALAPVIVVTTILEAIPYVKNVANAIPFLCTLLLLVFLKYVFISKKVKVLESVTV